MRVRLQIITPTFIGSGEQYYPYDYVILEDSLCFIDRENFIATIIDEGRYEEFLKACESIEKLLTFIDDYVQEKHYRGCIETEQEANEKLFSTKTLPLMAFIKDSVTFKPYIPGSTLKGAIRTALLDYKIDRFWNELKRVEKIKRLNDKQLETIIFCNEHRNHQSHLQFDPKKDILKALFVEDLKPLTYKLRAIKPLNRPYKKTKDNKIPVVLEALIEGEFIGEVRINKHLLNNDIFLKNNRFFLDEPLDEQLLQKAINFFFQKIYEKEKNRFRANFPEYEKGMLKIGKHAGAGSKSLNKLRSITIRQIGKKFDYQLSVWIDQEERPLGWVKVKFE